MKWECTHKRLVDIPPIGTVKHLFGKIEVDCGKCHVCMLKRRNQWVTRLAAQWQDTNNALWCLFTYDNEHVPAFNELGKKRFSAFMKRFRRYLEYHFNWKGVKFFCAGEYGEKNHRPHFHVIIFNLPKCPNGYLHICPAIRLKMEQLWKQGFVKVKQLKSVNQVYYCAKYAAKGLSEHEDVKPCILYSKGLGREYIKFLVKDFICDKKNILFNKSLSFNIGRFKFYPESIRSYRKWIWLDFELKSKLFHYLLSKAAMSKEEREEYLEALERTKWAEELVKSGQSTWKQLESKKGE